MLLKWSREALGMDVIDHFAVRLANTYKFHFMRNNYFLFFFKTTTYQEELNDSAIDRGS
jgi:hypothetical protein